MAMKVNKSTIHRISVDVSCGCGMYAEFKDTQCKTPLSPLVVNGEQSGETYLKVFNACSTHEKDAGLSMLQFIVGERLDEAVAEAQKAPAIPTHMYAVPGIEEGDTGGVIAVGGNVQSVVKVAKPVAVRPRTQAAPTVKTFQRTADQLAKAGAAPTHVQGGAAEMQMEEVAEDSRYTPHIEEALDFLDRRESGLFEDGEIEEGEEVGI